MWVFGMMFFSRNNDFTIPSSGISRIERTTLGGVEQAFLIQSENPQNPLLLFIHGGPSMPIPGVSCRSADYALAVSTKNLVKHFTVVFWDQRGTGMSYSKNIPSESMTVEQFIQDADELTDYLRLQFNHEKLYLAGHSWGTIIALSLAARHPEKFHSYTALSQITSWSENDRLGYEWVYDKATQNNDQRALKALREVGEPPYVESFKQWSVLRKWMMKYHSMFYDTGDKNSPSFFKGVKIMLKSPDYKIMDLFHSFVSGFKLSYSQKLIEDLAAINFFEDVKHLDIPIYFIHGRQENHVFSDLMVSYHDHLDAPLGKEIFWLENSSHMFHPDDAKLVETYLIERVLMNEG